ncbi:hypothetical protein INR49_007297 [Caranx melampygus]|nr:hypothetical protein INR49_007297 [Caranx melampygus]
MSFFLQRHSDQISTGPAFVLLRPFWSSEINLSHFHLPPPPPPPPPPDMSGHRNDSSQMNKIFHPDDDEDHSSRKSSSPGSSSSGPPCAGGVGSGAEGGRETEERQQGEAKERKEEREEGSSSSCCPQSDLRTRGPTRLTFSDIHTVLIDVTAFNHRGEIVPQRGRDSWQSDFVKLPSSQRNHMTKSGVFKGPAQVSRWEVIHKQLKNLASKKEVSVSAVEEAIMKYNPRYKGKWTFDALTSFVKRAPKEENYYSTLFPRIAALALRLPEEVRKVRGGGGGGGGGGG